MQEGEDREGQERIGRKTHQEKDEWQANKSQVWREPIERNQTPKLLFTEFTISDTMRKI